MTRSTPVRMALVLWLFASAAGAAGAVDGGGRGRVLEEYLIGPGDVLDIIVWRDQNLSQKVPVRPDGKISYPLIDDVQAAGQTAVQLKQTITRGLRQFISNPMVTVIVSEINNYKVTVLGEVTKPGVYLLKGRASVVEAISLAGGFSEFASKSNIVVVKRDGRRVRFNYNSFIAGEGGEQNVALDPGDSVIVK